MLNDNTLAFTRKYIRQLLRSLQTYFSVLPNHTHKNIQTGKCPFQLNSMSHYKVSITMKKCQHITHIWLDLWKFPFVVKFSFYIRYAGLKLCPKLPFCLRDYPTPLKQFRLHSECECCYNFLALLIMMMISQLTLYVSLARLSDIIIIYMYI